MSLSCALAALWSRSSRLSTVSVTLVALIGLSAPIGFLYNEAQQVRLREFQYGTRDVRILQQALIDAETGVRGYVMAGGVDYLQPYMAGLQALDEYRALLPKLDAFAKGLPQFEHEPTPVSTRVAALKQAYATAIGLTQDRETANAEQSLRSANTKPLMDALRSIIGQYVNQRADRADAAAYRISVEQDILLTIDLAGALIAIAAMLYAFRRSEMDARERESAISVSRAAREQVEHLFGMTDMLQSATAREDANEVLRATAVHLLRGFGGSLYVFNNSRDRLDLSMTWGDHGGTKDGELLIPDHISPGECWALKRGKPHVNALGEGSLRCLHAPAALVALEIPMVARGEVLGLLEIRAGGDDAETRLQGIRSIAMALADAMSLALSSIALRERLRNQALRDGLTGLYNRRFLEEMQERMALDADRRKAPLSAIMIDLDHFKKLNDTFGHSAGDAVLREVATAVLSCLRGTDVACRYGGEELAVLLPDCALDVAVARAEQIRARIAELSRTGSAISVTASLGVASMPDTCMRAADLLPGADAALYEAKRQGRDRVVVAASRSSAQRLALVESET
jgi:diguanylate cyclase (GGDEF)-like protein